MLSRPFRACATHIELQFGVLDSRNLLRIFVEVVNMSNQIWGNLINRDAKEVTARKWAQESINSLAFELPLYNGSSLSHVEHQTT